MFYTFAPHCILLLCMIMYSTYIYKMVMEGRRRRLKKEVGEVKVSTNLVSMVHFHLPSSSPSTSLWPDVIIHLMQFNPLHVSPPIYVPSYPKLINTHMVDTFPFLFFLSFPFLLFLLSFWSVDVTFSLFTVCYLIMYSLHYLILL